MTKIHQSQRITRWQGRDLTLAQIAQESGISHPTLHGRHRAGDRGDRLTRPVRAKLVPQKQHQVSV